MKGATFIRGHARFEGPHTIRVDDRVLEADKIFLNVGGRAVAPDMPGLSDIDYMTNVGILELDKCQSIWSSSAVATSPWSSRRCTAASVPA